MDNEFNWGDFQKAVEEREANAMPIKEGVPYLVVISGAEKKEKDSTRSVGISLTLKVNLAPDAINAGWTQGDRSFRTNDYVWFGRRNAETKQLEDVDKAYTAQDLIRATGFVGKNFDTPDFIGHTLTVVFKFEPRQDGDGTWPKIRYIRPYKRGDELSPVLDWVRAEGLAKAAKDSEADSLSDSDIPF